MNRSQIGVRFPAPDNAGSTLLYLTGSAEHFNLLRRRASDRGWRLTADGLQRADGARRTAASEEELYAALDLPLIPPEIRNGDDEIAAAERGALPRLLHGTETSAATCICTRSGATAATPIEKMVSTCRDLGYEYMAITDHSPAFRPRRRPSRFRTCGDRRRRSRRCASGFRTSRSCTAARSTSCPTGASIFPIACSNGSTSCWRRCTIAPAMGRISCCAAISPPMRHPLVTLITHPTNRLVPHRPGYDLDYDRLIEAAAATGTLLEIDGAPSHLDMDGALCPAGDRRRSDRRRGQRLPPRRDARASDASGRRHRAPRMGRARGTS